MMTRKKCAQESIVKYPWELHQYLLEYRQANPEYKSGTEQKKSFFQQRYQFTVRPEDVPRVDTKLTVHPSSKGSIVRSEDGRELQLDNFEHDYVCSLLAAIDGHSSVDQVACRALSQRVHAIALLQNLLGHFVSFPELLESLENRISGIEISRVPQSPYQIDRNYWCNMADVRERIAQDIAESCASSEAFQSFLKSLHVIASMGSELNSFYIPARWIDEDHMTPGAYLPHAPVVERVGENHLFLSIVTYFLKDESRSDRGTFINDERNVFWGILGEYYKNKQKVPYFRSPRPLTDAHFDALRFDVEVALAAKTGDSNCKEHRIAVLNAAASFHQKFVRMHPFGCINQSLAMNLVNYLLKLKLNLILPHLNLDFCALELSTKNYRVYFQNIVSEFAISCEEPNAYLIVQKKLTKTQEAFKALRDASGLPDVLALLESNGDYARVLGLPIQAP